MLDLLLYILGLIKDLEPDPVLTQDDRIAVVQSIEPYEDTEDMEVALNLLNHHCHKKAVGWDQNRHVITASIISDNDLDFISTLDAENGLWTVDRVGVTGDIGFCQISPYWHPEIVNDPNFYDPVWQLKTCYRLYKGGTRFYGYDVRYKSKPKFVCPNQTEKN